MHSVKIDFPASGLVTFASISPGEAKTGLISVSNITLAISPVEKSPENCTATVVIADFNGEFSALLAPDSPDRFILRREMKVYQQDTLIFSGFISDIPESEPLTVTIKADSYTSLLQPVSTRIKKTDYIAMPRENKKKFKNIILGTAEAPTGKLPAPRVGDGVYLASEKHLLEVTGVFLANGTNITASSTWENHQDGHTYIYNSNYNSESEIYFNCMGGFNTVECVDDGGFEVWNSPTDAASWDEYTSGGSTVNRDSSPLTGSFCCRIDVDADKSEVSVSQGVTLTPGITHHLTINYKNSEIDLNAQWRLFDTGENVYMDASGVWHSTLQKNFLDNSTSWETFELDFTPHPQYNEYVIFVNQGNARESSIYIDDISITRKEQIENPADMMAYIANLRGQFLPDAASFARAAAIYENRGYSGCLIVIDEKMNWKQFLTRFGKNFDCFIFVFGGVLYYSILDWGQQTADHTITRLYIDWSKFTCRPDFSGVVGGLQVEFDYDYRGKEFDDAETLDNETDWQASTEPLELHYHTSTDTVQDTGQRHLWFHREPPYSFTFPLPFNLGKNIRPGQTIELVNIKLGVFKEQNRLLLVTRNVKTGPGEYTISGDDITGINDGLILLLEDEEAVELIDESDPDCHRLL